MISKLNILIRSSQRVSIILCAISICGCQGYKLGSLDLYRPDIRTVYVPMIQSDSYRKGLGEQLTEAVVKEIEAKTPYKVVGREKADTILEVRLVDGRKWVIAQDAYDQARDVSTELRAQISWIDRQGQQLMQRSATELPNASLEIVESSGFVPEGGQSLVSAHQDAIQKLAKQIVAQMELPW